jgi:hypothetical protein
MLESWVQSVAHRALFSRSGRAFLPGIFASFGPDRDVTICS